MKLRLNDSVDRMRLSMEQRIDSVKDSMDRMRTSMEPVFDNVKGSMFKMRTAVSVNNIRERVTKRSSFRDHHHDGTTDSLIEDGIITKQETISLLSSDCNDTTASYDDESDDNATETSQSDQEQRTNIDIPVSSEVPQQQLGPLNPLVILPGLPFRLLPMLRWVPLRWLAHILINVMDNIKRALSRAFPGTVIYTKAPGYDDIEAFGEERGELWKMREGTENNVLLSLKSVPLEMCQQLEVEMNDFSSKIAAKQQRRRRCFGKRNKRINALVSSDMIHPSDLGYDFFGRHVAAAILEEWNKDET
mmetsp:Transcript_16892/g.23860  ORF Transcript_16892/g.23860 Transcript_16892/m.23860 type:complete len:304 (+) Transcript_16892:135-1046(+)